MTTLSLTDESPPRLALRCSPRYRDRAQTIPGLRFDRNRDAWLAPLSLPIARVTRAVFPDLEVGEGVYDAVRPQAERDFRVLALKTGQEEAPTFLANEDGFSLFPYQAVAAECAATQGGFINQDEKGNGKTPTTLAALEREGAFPALVICTNSMKGTWAEETRRWTSATPVILEGTPKKRADLLELTAERCSAGEQIVLIIGYSQATLHSKLGPYGSVYRTEEEKQDKDLNDPRFGFVAVVADEAHYLKDPKAKRTRAVYALGNAPSVRYRFALTATPIANHTIDLWGPLHFVDPVSFPSRTKFRDRYVLIYQNPWGGIEDMGLNPATEDEFRAIYDPISIRRPLQVEAKMLPPQYRFLEMEPAQRAAYDRLERDGVLRTPTIPASEPGGEKGGGILVATNPLLLNTRLQQLAAATPVVDQEGNVVELTMPSAKVDALIDLVGEMGGEPLVAFSESKKLIHLAYKQITKGRTPVLPPERVAVITGDVPNEERTRLIAEFQSGAIDLLMATIGAGSEGITLTRANTMCFLTRSYRALSNNQAEGRLLRVGQTRDVQVIDFITKGTVEYRVHEATQGKEELLQQIVRDPNWTRRFLPNAPSV